MLLAIEIAAGGLLLSAFLVLLSGLALAAGRSTPALPSELGASGPSGLLTLGLTSLARPAATEPWLVAERARRDQARGGRIHCAAAARPVGPSSQGQLPLF
jgi:hypothetical protein